MPNWVRNKITIESENYKEIIKGILTKVSEDNEQVDFNRILPMPESLNIISGTVTYTCINLFLNSIVKTDEFRKYITVAVLHDMNFVTKKGDDFDEEMNDCLDYNKDFLTKEKLFHSKEEVLAYGRKALDNILNYGYMDWYDWCINNWGTKWNACRTEIKNNVISFETAWDPVPKLIELLSKDYPNAKFYYDFSDECVSEYCGQLKIVAGETVESKRFLCHSDEALNFGLTLWPECKKYFKYDKSKKKYSYKDENME